MRTEDGGTIYEVVTHRPAQTRRVGEALGHALGEGNVVCLRGELGSGKTCLTQGVGRGLGVSGVIHSPTFVFINEHPPIASGPCLYHVDLYRLHDAADVFALGLDDYMYGDGVTVIEWADRAAELLPVECLWVTLIYLDERRRQIQFDAHGDSYVSAVERVAHELATMDLASLDECDLEP